MLRHFKCPHCPETIDALATEATHQCRYNRNRWTSFVEVTEEGPDTTSQNDTPAAPVAAVAPPAKGSAVSPKIIRAWAKAEGIVVGERGRLHPDVIQEYWRSH